MQTTAVSNSNAVRKETIKSDITVDSIKVSEYQKPGTKTAQLRQTVTTNSFYPSKKIESSMSANLFELADFGFEEQKYESVENRVAWILVPEAVTEEQFKIKLEAAHKNGATIYKVLSNEPILDENQKYAISIGQRDLNHFANVQALRYPSNEATLADGTAGKLILDDKGNVQYRRTFLWLTPQEDVDMRGKSNIYASPELKAEMTGASVMQGQTL